VRTGLPGGRLLLGKLGDEVVKEEGTHGGRKRRKRRTQNTKNKIHSFKIIERWPHSKTKKSKEEERINSSGVSHDGPLRASRV